MADPIDAGKETVKAGRSFVGTVWNRAVKPALIVGSALIIYARATSGDFSVFPEALAGSVDGVQAAATHLSEGTQWAANLLAGSGGAPLTPAPV